MKIPDEVNIRYDSTNQIFYVTLKDNEKYVNLKSNLEKAINFCGSLQRKIAKAEPNEMIRIHRDYYLSVKNTKDLHNYMGIILDSVLTDRLNQDNIEQNVTRKFKEGKKYGLL